MKKRCNSTKRQILERDTCIFTFILLTDEDKAIWEWEDIYLARIICKLSLAQKYCYEDIRRWDFNKRQEYVLQELQVKA